MVRKRASGSGTRIHDRPSTRESNRRAADVRVGDAWGFGGGCGIDRNVPGAQAKARDARARQLRSWLEVRGERLRLRVDDREARYPVVVDPWIQQAELTATDGGTGDYFGASIAVSGNTVVVGAPQHTVGSNSAQGAAYVFAQSGGTWSEQAQHLMYSVGLSP
jgi:FG-GAP repeat